MFGYNGYSHQSASHCAAAACTCAPIIENADTARVLVVSVFAGEVQ
ncbi:MAG: hypothetical protein IJZ39_09530 [Oscillospiraceae bacterium]|nr:hypothetical protein [Oscillospiraceae bacterium]